MNDSKQVTIAPRSLVAFVLVLMGGVLFVALVYAAREILAQLLVAILLAMSLEPPVQALERRGLTRGRAVGLTFFLAVCAAIAFVLLLVPPLITELTKFTQGVPGLLQKLAAGQGPLGFLEQRFQVVERARAWIAERGGPETFGRPALQFLGGALNSATAVITVAFLTFFVGLGGGRWFAAFLRVVPDSSRERWQRMGRGVSKAIGGYAFGNLLISVIAGAVTTAVLLATRVPYPIPLGIAMAVLDLIPMVGATLGAVIVGAVALTKGPVIAVIVLASMWAYQQIENNVLIQMVYHRTVQLSPLAIAVSVAAGAEIGGIVGALFAIPVAGALKVVAREVVAWRRGEIPPEEAPPPARSWPPRWWRRTQADRASAP